MYSFATWAFWLSLGTTVVSLIYLVLDPTKPFPQNLFEKERLLDKAAVCVIYVSIALMLVFGVISLSSMETAGRATAESDLLTHYNIVEPTRLKLGESVCYTSSWYFCQTWEATYTVNDENGAVLMKGIVRFDPGSVEILENKP